jgi:hypothetical protein
MTLVNDIKKQLGQYLAGTSTLLEFQEWLDRQDPTNEDVQALTLAIEWAFCDLERGASVEVLKQTLSQLAAVSRPVIVGDLFYSPFASSGTSSKLQQGEGIVLSGQMKILHETVPV